MPKLIDIRKARKRRGWTQVDLAQKSGVNQTTISDLETGRSLKPTFDVMQKVADALECDPRELRIGPARQPEAAR